jgi:hypothetical protein
MDAAMTDAQVIALALSNVPTILAVLIGILVNNSRLSDLRADISARFAAESRVQEANFKVLLGKIEDIDSRLTRLEERFSRG